MRLVSLSAVVFVLGGSSAAFGQDLISTYSVSPVSDLTAVSIAQTRVLDTGGTISPGGGGGTITPGGGTITPIDPGLSPCTVRSLASASATSFSMDLSSVSAISNVSFTTSAVSRCNAPGPGPSPRGDDQLTDDYWEDAFGGSFTLPLTDRLDLEIGGELMLRTDTDRNEMLDLTGNSVELGTIYEFAPGVHGGFSYQYRSHEVDKNLEDNTSMLTMSLSARF